MISLLIHAIYTYTAFFRCGSDEVETCDTTVQQVIMESYLLFVVILHGPIVALQLRSQGAKLCKPAAEIDQMTNEEEIPDD